MEPRMMPIMIAMPTATKPTLRETLLPQIIRDKRALPSSSVPSICALSGGERTLYTSIDVGAYGAITGARREMVISAKTTIAPMTDSLFLVNRLPMTHKSLIFYPLYLVSYLLPTV